MTPARAAAAALTALTVALAARPSAAGAASAPGPTHTACIGAPNAGALRSGHQLPPSAVLHVKRGSEERAWGHPLLLELIERGARAAARALPGSIALVGDLSAPSGGPLSGHASHQAGRDADVGFFISDERGQPVLLDAFEAFDGQGRSVVTPDHVFDTYRNWLLLRAWLSDLRVVVTHVFVSAELRQLLLDFGRQSPEFERYVPLAAQVLHAHPNHADHFHLRIACPLDQDGSCRDNTAPPRALEAD